MVFRCQECGNIFEMGEEKKWVEPHGENMEGCPVCGGVYEEVYSCIKCGNYNCDLQGDMCDNCKLDIVKRFRTLLHKNFHMEEIEYLKNKYDTDF